MFLRRFASSAAANRFSLPPTIRQLLAEPPQTESNTVVSGWIKSIRKQKNVSFAVLTDGSSTTGLQAVLLKGKEDEILRRSVFCIAHIGGLYIE
jgi:asparaginyl-tRNA synthetase